MISLRDVVTGFGNRDPLAEVWRRDLLGGGSAEITGTLPLSFSGRGKPLTDYLISGNTIQDGTPTPEAPVDVVGCGVWDETQQSYKLPLTVNGTEYPIYLGTVPTTRRIKKLVLTGEESISVTSTGMVVIVLDIPPVVGEECVCSHYIGTNVTSYSAIGAGECTTSIVASGGGNRLAINDIGLQTADAYKAFFAQQYAAGTPVTVWYVLEEPETAVVNEPLMKIGDYADTISFAQTGVTIPTVNGANVLDMSSTVKPSEMYIKGKGIKPTNDPNFENGG